MNKDNWVKIVVAVIGAVGVILAALITVSWDNRGKVVSYVRIDNYDAKHLTLSGTAILSKDKPIWILVYAGKAGGPYWLQGINGSRYTETSKKQQHDSFTVNWTVSEVHLGSDVTEIYAIAVLPKNINNFVDIGIPDSESGDAVKVESLALLPDAEGTSESYTPNQ